MDTDTNFETFVGILERESDKAWLIEIKHHGAIWFPKSQCRIIHPKPIAREIGCQVELDVPDWLVREKELG